MSFTEQQVQAVLDYVRDEPRTVFDISKKVDRSWVTTEKYLRELHEKTGLIRLKTFREGTQGALKIVYYTPNELSMKDEVQKNLAQQILNGRLKTDFDFMDLFQFVPSAEKKAAKRKVLQSYSTIAKETAENPAKEKALIFSGNLSYISYNYKGKSMPELIEDELEGGASIKVLTRVSLSSLSNIEKVAPLLVKYPGQFEIRHRYHPLRGVLVDGKFARFRTEEKVEDYRKGELPENARVYYEITSPEWIAWMESIFWKMWRSSVDFTTRIKEVKGIQ